jgi:hypothetical protein
MLIHRRHRRTARIILVLLALANAGFAHGGAWRCDTGQLCQGHAAGQCCCPRERQPSACTGTESACCRSDSPTRVAAEVSVPAVPVTWARRSTARRRPLAVSSLAPVPCRCVFTVAVHSAAGLAPATLAAGALPTAAPAGGVTTSLAPLLVTPAAPGNDAPPPALDAVSPRRSRAPPTC